MIKELEGYMGSLQNIVDDMSGTLKDDINNGEKRVGVEVGVSVEMSCVNLAQNVLIGHGDWVLVILIVVVEKISQRSTCSSGSHTVNYAESL